MSPKHIIKEFVVNTELSTGLVFDKDGIVGLQSNFWFPIGKAVFSKQGRCWYQNFKVYVPNNKEDDDVS